MLTHLSRPEVPLGPLRVCQRMSGFAEASLSGHPICPVSRWPTGPRRPRFVRFLRRHLGGFSGVLPRVALRAAPDPISRPACADAPSIVHFSHSPPSRLPPTSSLFLLLFSATCDNPSPSRLFVRSGSFLFERPHGPPRYYHNGVIGRPRCTT